MSRVNLVTGDLHLMKNKLLPVIWSHLNFRIFLYYFWEILADTTIKDLNQEKLIIQEESQESTQMSTTSEEVRLDSGMEVLIKRGQKFLKKNTVKAHQVLERRHVASSHLVIMILIEIGWAEAAVEVGSLTARAKTLDTTVMENWNIKVIKVTSKAQKRLISM